MTNTDEQERRSLFIGHCSGYDGRFFHLLKLYNGDEKALVSDTFPAKGWEFCFCLIEIQL